MTEVPEALVDKPAVPPPGELRVCPICGPSVQGETWTDGCECGCVRVRHEDSKHATASIGQKSTCSGRNLAGRCRTCPDCPRFRPAKERTDVR